MAAAVGIGVIASARTRLFIGLARWLHLWGLGRWGAFGLPRHSGKCSAERRIIGGFAIGGNRWVAAQRIGGGAV